MSKLRLSHILIGLGLVWVGTCMAIHGPAILAYVVLQAATSGVFAYAIHRSVKKQLGGSAKTQVRLTTSESEPVRLETTTAQAG